MSKKVAGFLLVLDLAFLGVVGFLTWQRYLELQRPVPEAAPIAPEALPASEPVAVSTDTATVALSTAAVAVDASSATPVAVSTETASATPPDTVAPAPGPIPAASVPPGAAKIKATRFTYYSRTANQVQIVGDFNNWNPQNFRRNDKGGWVISLPIPPGDYSYNYLVDGKTVRDPNQPRTDTQGRSLLSLSRPADTPSPHP